MSRTLRWVARTGELSDLLKKLGEGPLAVDTEADSMHHYPEKVCLVQLSFGRTDLLVDPLAGVDLESALRQPLNDPVTRKIMHGADYDLRMLDRDFGLTIRGLYDTMIAARLAGEREFGLAALMERHLGIKLDKRYQRADWSLRPLPDEMRAYAAMDTRHLEELAGLLQEELERLGRSSWAAEEFARLEEVRWQEPDGGEAYRRVKGSGGLDRRALEILRALVTLRESMARKADRPPFKIIGNNVLFAIAKEKPRSEKELAGMRPLPASWSRGRRLQRLWDVVSRALERPESELPEIRKRARKRSNKSFEKKLRRLGALRDGLAAELGLEPSLLAPRAVLEQVLTNMEDGREPWEAQDLRRWQADVLRPAINRLDG
jgi:ribonuclease D